MKVLAVAALVASAAGLATVDSNPGVAWREGALFAGQKNVGDAGLAHSALKLGKEELEAMPKHAVEDAVRENGWWTKEGASSNNARAQVLTGGKRVARPVLSEESSSHEESDSKDSSNMALELKRMGALMRRQLAPRVYSYSFLQEGPSMMPSPLPTTLPTGMPTSLPTPMPTAMPTSLSDVGSGDLNIIVTSGVYVSGLAGTEFDDEELLVLKRAFADVLGFVGPDDVLDASAVLLNRRLAEKALLASGRQLEDAVTAEYILNYVININTPREAGFNTADLAVTGTETRLQEASTSGELQERIKYWADFYGVDTFDNLTFPPDITAPDGTWSVYEPEVSPAPTPTAVVTTAPTPAAVVTTAAPTPVTDDPPTDGDDVTPSPTPSTDDVPTDDVPTPPTDADDPDGSDDVTAAPTPVATDATEPTTDDPDSTDDVQRASSKKKKSSGQSTAEVNGMIAGIVIAIIVFLCCIFFFCYIQRRERKLTERKDSWDISTMFTDEANLPDAEEMIDVEPETEPVAEPEDVAGATLIEGGASDVVPLSEEAPVPTEDQPQALQKITQAAEL
jgi:hypothetical protein